MIFTTEWLVALTVFALVASCTPGPNNFMLVASVVNFGFRRTVPHMAGIIFGFGSLLLALGLGLSLVLTVYPSLRNVIKVVGGAYLLYLAWRIAMSRSASGKSGDKLSAVPLSFLQAFAFQWVNPKAWIMGSSAMALYAADGSAFTAAAVALIFAVLAIPSVLIWSSFGMALRQFLADPVRLKWFNILMGVLLALTVIPMIR